MKKIDETNVKFNIFLGDELNKISNSPSVQGISKELFSSKKVAFERSDSLLKNIQLLLNNVIYDKNEIIEKISYIFRERNKRETFFYKSILDENFVSSLVYMNYDYIFEDNFSSLIKKSTPFLLNRSESFQIPFYKIFGDFKTENKCILSTQDLKKLKVLDFYKEFWDKLKSEIEKNPTVLLGIDFRDSVNIEILNYLFAKTNRKYKQIYVYVNKESEEYLEKEEVQNLIGNYSIKVIKGENREFLNVFKTMIFQEFNSDFYDESLIEEKLERVIGEDFIEIREAKEEVEEINEIKKLPIFEENSKKIILKNYIDFSKKKNEELDENTRIINMTSANREDFFETATEIKFKTLFLDKFPIKYKNFSNNIKPVSVQDLGFIDIDFGFEKQNSMGVKIIDYPKFRLIEMKRRDFKISIGVDFNSSICLKTNGYYEYEIYRGSKNFRLIGIFNFMMNLFQGSTIKFHSNNFMCDLKVESFLEYGKFKALDEILRKYENLRKTFRIKNKNFSDLDNSFYQIDLLENHLKSNVFDSWINARIKISEDNIIEVGNNLILKRENVYYLKNISYNLMEVISLKDEILKSEIKDGYLILKRKPVQIILEEIKK